MKVIFYDVAKETLCSYSDVIQISTVNCGKAMWRLHLQYDESDGLLLRMSNYKLVRVEMMGVTC